MGNSKVAHLRIPALKRAGNKLAVWQSSAKLMAVIDALLDIRPRRTSPGGCEVLIIDDHVFLASEESDGEFIGMADELIRTLNGIADAAELDDEERDAVMEAVNDARVDDVDDGVVWLRRAQPSFDTSG